MMEGKAQIIDGKALADTIRQETAAQVAKLDIQPGLAVILVGHDSASEIYVALKSKAAKEVGIMFSLYRFPDNVTETELLEAIDWLNQDVDIDGILVQLPLPAHLDTDKIIQAIDPKKDADGFHAHNIQKLASGESYVIPGLANGILQLLLSTKEDLKSKQALIVARSPEFTGALSYLLQEFGIANTIVAPDDNELKNKTKKADILIIAAGVPNWIKKEDIKTGAIIIDVGTNRLSDNSVVGDVDFSDCLDKAAWITPVPGGVGPMTVAMLLKNTVALAIAHQTSP